MSQGTRTANHAFEITGTGVAVGSFDFFPLTELNVRLKRIVIRQELGGGATACTIYGVQNRHQGADPALIPEENVPLETDSIVPTASATQAFLDSPISMHPTFSRGLKLFVKVTAGAGAWTFKGYLELER